MSVGDEWMYDGRSEPNVHYGLRDVERDRAAAIRRGELVVAHALTEEMNRIAREDS